MATTVNITTAPPAPVTVNSTPVRDAYQLALAEGFTGSRAAWLASLAGAPGPAGPAPAGTGLVSVTDGVPDPPSALNDRLEADRNGALGALGLGAPIPAGPFSASAIELDFVDGPNQSLSLVLNASPNHTIGVDNSVEGARLFLYIDNPYGNCPNLNFDAYIAPGITLPKKLEGGVYIAELVGVAGGQWFLRSLSDAINPPAPTLHFKPSTDSKWYNLNNWFLNAAATDPAPSIPWVADNIYKNSDLELATGAPSETVVVTGDYYDMYPPEGTYITQLGTGFTISGKAKLGVNLSYITVNGGTFEQATYMSNCTINSSDITLRADSYWVSAVIWNNSRFTFAAVMMYTFSMFGGIFKCTGTDAYGWMSFSTDIHGGYWDIASGIANPIPYNPATGLGFLNAY
jgi:hypothetical protein